ncbi:MAG: exosortase/archaeosortase family protein [Rhodocyclaceae bacterium]|nr:exosortase/archaeosortase family protein [Rhodocyclaceae bacterium]
MSPNDAADPSSTTTFSVESYLAPRPQKPRRAWQGATIFMAVFVVLQVLYGLAEGTAAERWIVERATVAPAVAALQVLRPEWLPRADGARVVAANKRINVRYGCEGTEVVFLLAAALLAVQAPWRWRLVGLACGIAAIWVFNQVRLLALVQVVVERREWFPVAHGALAPLAVIVLTAVFFVVWLRALPHVEQA